ncbi:uncharacterized protein TNCV_5140221 [Trichonephila clavipes]|nr:uncharacterized protein TNCV_5140221 [Trichonephila clavipes]
MPSSLQWQSLPNPTKKEESPRRLYCTNQSRKKAERPAKLLLWVADIYGYRRHQERSVERGFLVNKVAQLTKLKSKFKLPIFMVELQKSPDSPDIFKLDKCCYLTVKIDTFNRRPGPTQCYTCNLFNHSSKNCHIKTRCLKCGEPHRTDDCPIRNLIENPVCINCKETGHLANSHRCAKFPKIQPKKVLPP